MNIKQVADHYNAVKQRPVTERKDSKIINLRSFNNWIKSCLINTYVKRGDHVLELACGKGGDLLKWRQAGISYLLGADIADISIQNAQSRYNDRNFNFKADFACIDCFGVSLSQVTKRQKFDIVSCQFALHYAFESESRARQALKNIGQHLVTDGYFIGTIPNSNLLVKKLLHASGLSFGNSIFNVRFENKTNFDIYGHVYHFELDEAVNDCPEYLVHFETLITLAREYGMKLVLLKPFHFFYEEKLDEYFDLFQRMRVCANGAFDADCWEATGLYNVFAFKKL